MSETPSRISSLEESSQSGNPLFPGKGVCDPHVRIFNDRAYLYATHDASPDNDHFVMNDWWIWSSDDLVNWRHECTLNPRDTWLGDGFNRCWATDAMEQDGKYYWYISEGADSTTVMVGDTPIGPWKDVLGHPLIQRRDLGGSAAHDPGLLKDDDGSVYMAVGYKQYYLLKLSRDMISFDGPPQKIDVIDPVSPLGVGILDDKPTLHKRNGIYYLSWGCYYAVSDRIEGPYQCKGSFLLEENIAPEFRYSLSSPIAAGFREPLRKAMKKVGAATGLPSSYDRHGSFFAWRGQDYFICNDHSHSGTPFYRDCCIAYVSYNERGEILPITINAQGVRQISEQGN